MRISKSQAVYLSQCTILFNVIQLTPLCNLPQYTELQFFYFLRKFILMQKSSGYVETEGERGKKKKKTKRRDIWKVSTTTLFTQKI